MTIPTYFSHSYRLGDQDLNRAIWRIFAAEDFSFFVDPPSDSTIHAHLERMMRRCSAFVAVVNRRLDGSPNFCSPFVLYEFGLATQARRPQLLLIDKDIDAAQFDNLREQEKMFFSREFPKIERDELVEKARALRRTAEHFPNWLGRPRGRIGIMMPHGDGSCAYAQPSVLERIREVARACGFIIDEIEVPHKHNASLALTLDRHEAIILDVRGNDLPEWVFSYVYGRLVPTIKLVRLEPHEYPESVALSPLVEGLRMDEREPCVESLTFWRDPDDLIWQLGMAFQKLDRSHPSFKQGEEGEVYFESIGRRPANVFVSNAGGASDFALEVVQALTIRGIHCFHYRNPGAIAPGTNWQETIRTAVRSCDVFVAIIGKGYDISPWCQIEMHEARARLPNLVLLPFMVEKVDVGFMDSIQVAPLPTDPAKRVDFILGHIRSHLIERGGANADTPSVPLLGGSREVIVDTIRHIPDDLWPGFVDRMANAGVTIAGANGPGSCIRPRGDAEAIFALARQAIPSNSGADPVKSLVEALIALAAPSRTRPLENILARMKQAGTVG